MGDGERHRRSDNERRSLVASQGRIQRRGAFRLYLGRSIRRRSSVPPQRFQICTSKEITGISLIEVPSEDPPPPVPPPPPL